MPDPISDPISEYNQVASVTNPLGRTTAYQYGREPGCVTCGYLPTLTMITLPSGKKTEMEYDRSGKLVKRIVAPGTSEAATTLYVYNPAGEMAQMIDPRGFITQFTYDLLERIKTSTDPGGDVTSWGYDAVGNVLTTTRPDSSQNSYTYDSMDRQLTATNPKNETITTAFHPSGSVASLTDPRGEVTTFQIDALSRNTRIDYPGGYHEAFAFDAVGNPTTLRNKGGYVETRTYDARNRQNLSSWSSTNGWQNPVTRSYDATNQLLTCDTVDCELDYSYDAAGQLLSETYTFPGLYTPTPKTVAYAYDIDGNARP